MLLPNLKIKVIDGNENIKTHGNMLTLFRGHFINDKYGHYLPFINIFTSKL
jgi:hypothetical protein